MFSTLLITLTAPLVFSQISELKLKNRLFGQNFTDSIRTQSRLSTVSVKSTTTIIKFLSIYLYNKTLKKACVASVSARVRRESCDESKKEEWRGGGGERRKPLLPFPSPLYFFVSNSIANACYAGYREREMQTVNKKKSVLTFLVWIPFFPVRIRVKIGKHHVSVAFVLEWCKADNLCLLEQRNE